ncbi:MAG: VOC family protein [bacterium JZ-2024 1]
MAYVYNAISYVELPSTDLEKTRFFYERVFGWTFQEVPDMNYVLFTKDGAGCGGFRRVDQIPPIPGVICSITVRDINETLDRIVEAGGSVVMPKTPLPDGAGYIAEFADPCGVICGLWSPPPEPALDLMDEDTEEASRESSARPTEHLSAIPA